MNLVRARAGAAGVVALALLLTGCSDGSMSSHHGHDGSVSGMMGGGSGFRRSPLTCSAPGTLPGTRVDVTLADMGMSHVMGGDAPMGAGMMRLLVSTTHVRSGLVSLVASNRGWRTHELVVLPLAAGVPAGRRAVGGLGRVSETGSLGEASSSCAAGSGEGIRAGSAGWTTLRLAPGRYELVCNLRNHYADGMWQAIEVS